MGPEDDLRMTVEVWGKCAAITLDGNLDDYTAPLLRGRLDECRAHNVAHMEVVLRHIGLLDSSGLSVLVRGYKLFTECGGDFVLEGDDDAVAHLLKRTGLDAVIPLHALPKEPRAEATLGAWTGSVERPLTG